MLKILVVIRHLLVRQALKMQIELDSDLKVVGEVEDCAAAYYQVNRYKPDVILIDLDAPCMDEDEIARELSSRAPEIPIILLSLNDDTPNHSRVKKAGAARLVTKEANTVLLIEAIREVARVAGPVV